MRAYGWAVRFSMGGGYGAYEFTMDGDTDDGHKKYHFDELDMHSGSWAFVGESGTIFRIDVRMHA